MSKLTEKILEVSKQEGMDGFSCPLEYFYDFLEMDIISKKISPEIEFIEDRVETRTGRFMGQTITCSYNVRYFKYLGELHSVEILPNSWDDGGSEGCNWWTLQEVKTDEP